MSLFFCIYRRTDFKTYILLYRTPNILLLYIYKEFNFFTKRNFQVRSWQSSETVRYPGKYYIIFSQIIIII